MRSYIFSFDQEKIVGGGITLSETLLLDYLYRFFDSGKAIATTENKKSYYFISAKKILSDLPILGIKERQLRNMLLSLETKGFVERLKNKPGECYLHLNVRQLFAEGAEKFYDSDGKKLPAIENQKIEKIKKINKKNSFENYQTHDYSDFDLNSVFDDLDTLEI